MSGDQVKPHRDVPGDRHHRLPAHLSMATFTILPQRGDMRVAVAPATTPGDVRRNRPPVIVTPKAGRLRMRCLQAIPRSFLVVE